MKLSTIALAFFLAAAAAPGWAAQAPRQPAALHLPLRFDKVPLGNVARILSAQFQVTVAIAANARAPITGDFSGMDLQKALAAAGSQCGLVVVPLGSGPSGGYSLCLPKPDAPELSKDGKSGGVDAPGTKAKLEDAERRRLELLKRQQGLLDQSNSSEPES